MQASAHRLSNATFWHLTSTVSRQGPSSKHTAPASTQSARPLVPHDAPVPLYCSVLKVELSGTGAIKTLPYLVMFLMSNVGGWAGDWFITKRKMSVAGGRKAVNTLGRLHGEV